MLFIGSAWVEFSLLHANEFLNFMNESEFTAAGATKCDRLGLYLVYSNLGFGIVIHQIQGLVYSFTKFRVWYTH